MARLRVYRENTLDNTAVSNRFIDEYMPGANDAQLKVYLYLLRMLSAGLSTSVSDMADLFNHTEKDILRALKYWEKQGLLEMDYDNQGNLTGIHLLDISMENNTKTQNNSALALHMDSVSKETSFKGTSFVGPAFKEPVFEAPAPKEPAFKKPTYSAAQLMAAKDTLLTKEFLFVIESYIGKPLSPTEMRSVLFIKDVLSFSDDLVYYLFEYCVGRGKKDLKYIEKVAISWAEEGVTTPEEAQSQAGKYDSRVYTVMNELGKSGSPTPVEVEYITRWMNEYGFDQEVIAEACKRTVLATDKNRFDYAEGILSNWRKQNVKSLEDVSKADALHQKRVISNRTTGTANTNKFNQFAKTEYNFDELEKKLIRNY